MAGWTTLRVAHTPTPRPSAAHKLHRAPPREMKKYKQYPARRSGIAGPKTLAKEAANQPAHTPFLQSQPRNPAPSPRSVTFPKSPVTFAEMRIRTSRRDPVHPKLPR